MKKKPWLALILIVAIAVAAFVTRPYNTVESNAATLYYQSYKQMYSSIKAYVDRLESYNATKEAVYLEEAKLKLEQIRDNITLFKLANQIQFRNTYINESVEKADFFNKGELENLSGETRRA